MTFAAALWLLLLHAVSGIAVVSVPDDSRAAHSVSAFAANADRLVATPQRFPTEGVRASYAAPISAIARPSWRAPSIGISAFDDVERPAPRDPAFTSRTVALRPHASAPRANRAECRFPYFPTAPPVAT